MSPRIHIICVKPEMCTLIKKALSGYDYIVSCTSGEHISMDPIISFQEKIDCLIIDRDIDPGIKARVREVFSKSFVIYLPTLENDENSFDDSKNISAPLKLSELSERLESLFKFDKI